MLQTAVRFEGIVVPGPAPSDPSSASSGPAAGPSPVTSHQNPPMTAAAVSARDVILVVSPGIEPSRGLVVTNLAAAFVEAGQQALVVTTADLRQRNNLGDTLVVPTIDAEPTPEVVAAATRPTDVPGVRSLALSRLLTGPGQLATRAPAILSAARQVADVVIIDAPVLATHDAEALVPAVDVVVVVVQAGWTKADHAVRSGTFLRRIAAPVLGAVLTEVYLGPKDLRRMAEHTARPDPDDEDRLVGASRMSRHGRRRRRERLAEA
jgi:Mrp family chromosome partitioning ATPase